MNGSWCIRMSRLHQMNTHSHANTRARVYFDRSVRVPRTHTHTQCVPTLSQPEGSTSGNWNPVLDQNHTNTHTQKTNTPYTHTRTCTHKNTYKHKHTHTHARALAYDQNWESWRPMRHDSHAQTHRQTHTNAHTFTNSHTHTHTHARAPAWHQNRKSWRPTQHGIRTHTHTHTNQHKAHTHIHTHTKTHTHARARTCVRSKLGVMASHAARKSHTCTHTNRNTAHIHTHTQKHARTPAHLRKIKIGSHGVPRGTEVGQGVWLSVIRKPDLNLIKGVLLILAFGVHVSSWRIHLELKTQKMSADCLHWCVDCVIYNVLCNI